MFSKGIKVFIAVLVIGVLFTAGIAMAKPAHNHGKGHVATLFSDKGKAKPACNATDKKNRVKIRVIAGKVSIEASSTVSPDHVHLRLVNATGKTIRAAQSKKDGTYRFKNLKLAPGDFKINAWVKKAKIKYSGETTFTVESSGTVSGNLNFALKKKP